MGSLNIVNVMESGKFRDSVHSGMDALTVVSDVANIQNAQELEKLTVNYIQLVLV